jgi:hypothetical protein
MATMKLLIRIAQVLLAIAALNEAYGVALVLGLSAFGGNKPSLQNIVESLVSILIFCFIIFLLQRYYEHKARVQAGGLSGRRFFGIALSGLSVAALIGFALVVLIVIMALTHL